MRALAAAWTSSGGNVVGLAPSAAAAEELRTSLDDGTSCVVADNLAKLVWAIGHQEPLADTVGLGTLVVIDEAGMADTLTLDHVVTWCLDRGASVRLIGDDQQLGAIGAGGVLRDIAATHGALHLDTVMRFTDPAEAAASLALRAGDLVLSGSTSTTTGSTSSTPTPPPPASSPPGKPTGPLAWTHSCSPPPATKSPTSTTPPALPASTGVPPARK
jgi:ATP-dependent exoDNAse (exonuclease V) alpha subunit